MIVSLLPLPVFEGHYDESVSDCSCFPTFIQSRAWHDESLWFPSTAFREPEGKNRGLRRLLTIVFTAVAVPIMILIEKDGVKPMPSVTSFSASLNIS